MDDRQEVTIENIIPLVEENLMTDGYLHPVVFVCGKEVGIVDISKGLKDSDAKDSMIEFLCDIIEQHEAHKVIILTEAWAYEAPKGMDLNEIRKIVKEGNHRERFDKKEIYQITEITKEHVSGYSREFTRGKENHIVLGKGLHNEGTQLDRFLPVQQALHQLQ